MHDEKSSETSPSPSNVCTALGSGKVGGLETKHYGAITIVPVSYWPGGVVLALSALGCFHVSQQTLCLRFLMYSLQRIKNPLQRIKNPSTNNAGCSLLRLIVTDCEAGTNGVHVFLSGTFCGRL